MGSSPRKMVMFRHMARGSLWLGWFGYVEVDLIVGCRSLVLPVAGVEEKAMAFAQGFRVARFVASITMPASDARVNGFHQSGGVVLGLAGPGPSKGIVDPVVEG